MIKVSELTGAQLDYWVAKALGLNVLLDDLEGRGVQWDNVQPAGFDVAEIEGPNYDRFSPSQWWEQGGQLIEHKRISLIAPGTSPHGEWMAAVDKHPELDEGTGPTALIAAMRAFVASKFGEEVAQFP